MQRLLSIPLVRTLSSARIASNSIVGNLGIANPISIGSRRFHQSTLLQQSSPLRVSPFVVPQSSLSPVSPWKVSHSSKHFHMSAYTCQRLTKDTVNPLVQSAEYAVRGQLVIRAGELEKKLREGDGKDLPFDHIIYCNIGNPQAVGQQPISFPSQLLSALCNPELMNASPEVLPPDVRDRAQKYLKEIPGGLGAYSDSRGLDVVRKEVASFIEKRDGFDANSDHIFLTNGASPAVQYLIQLLIRDAKDGIMIPIPQYPLYSATIKLFGGSQINYLLDEDKEWGLSIDELERSFDEAVKSGIVPRALAVINPGNPTGQCLSEENIAEIIAFANEKKIVLLADEVYQENIYVPDRPFHSFKKVLCQSPASIRDSLQLASFHSVSKGFLGECGKRGGYVEMVNFDKDIVSLVYKLASVNLCPNLVGQMTVAAMVNPPKSGDASFELYNTQKNSILESLKSRAARVSDLLNAMEGVTCNSPQGAMYAFPQIRLPEGAVKAAKEAGVAPDFLYCSAVLEETGICVVPGSGFGQKDGTFHFRTTFLPQPEEIECMAERLSAFHAKFMKKYQ